MKFADAYPELAELTKGSSPSQLKEVVNVAAILRLASKDQLNDVNFKIGTKKKLAALVEFGYLASPEPDWFFTTDKAMKLLEFWGYERNLYALNLQPNPDDHLRAVAAVIYRERAVNPLFFHVLYPSFNSPSGDQKTWLTPDFLLIEAKSDKSHKLTFVEVERPKPGWDEYLAEKERKYRELGQRLDLWDKWWRKWAKVLRLPMCAKEEFKFGVRYEKIQS